MAKSTNFFGLRRGSTKSLTFQVYRGQQVTKDRVTSVRNPQSSAQMQQRLRMPLVANARAVLKDLVNHSWEGVSYGNESLKLFSQLNLAKDALNIREYVPKGAMDCGLADFFISRGSLEPFTSITTTGSEFRVNGLTNVAKDATMPALDSKFSGEWAKAFVDSNSQLQYGDQLTFLVCIKGKEYTYAKDADNTGTAHYHKFVISRLILDEEHGDENWKVDLAEEGHVKITDGYMAITLTNTAQADASQNVFDVQVIADNIGVDEVDIESLATIWSRKVGDVWKRSTNRLYIGVSTVNPSYDDVLYSYLNADTISAKYLNSGTEGVSITGGNV